MESNLPEAPRLNLDYGAFYRITDSCITHLSQDEYRRFQKNLLQILPDGQPVKTGYYYWRFAQDNPMLTWFSQAEYDSLVALETPAEVSPTDLREAVWTDDFDTEEPADPEPPAEGETPPAEEAGEKEVEYDEFGAPIGGYDEMDPDAYTPAEGAEDLDMDEFGSEFGAEEAEPETPAEEEVLIPTDTAAAETLPPGPQGGAPLLKFTATNLAYDSREDKSLMKETSGYLDLSTNTYHAQQARYD
jgi:hypothetical protein